MITIRLRDDWTEPIKGDEYKAQDFLELDEALAKELVDTGTAEYKTPDAVRLEKVDAAKQKAEVDRKKISEERRSEVRVVGERAEQDPKGGFAYLGEFAQHVAQACRQGGAPSPKLAKWSRTSKSYTVEGDDSQGGYLVPPEYHSALMQTALEAANIRPLAQFIPMQTNRIAINAVVDEDHSTSLFGGIVLYRTGEAEQKQTSKPTFRQVELTLHKITGLVGVSDEIIEDSPISMEPLLTTLFGKAIAWQEDDDFLNGTGVGQALGVLNAPCLIVQGIEPAQPANTVVYANIVNMWSRMHPDSHKNSVWMCNQSVIPQLYQMGLAVGTGGGPVFVPPGGASASPYASLFGRPLIITEKCAALSAQGDILLADWSQYLIGGKANGAVKVASSMHLWFQYDVQAFRFVLRYDGQPWWRVALTPKNGATLSPFVTLAVRP